ncbi:MAG: hypothetical protein MK132_02330 [Lentisphaerales bacterium]|nr:hypothetical protein [Lentisphaerales bacterium]
MKRNSLSLFTVIILFLSYSYAYSEVRFHPLFTDNMVIQQGVPIKIFGTESVPVGDLKSKLKISFAGKSVYAEIDKDGNWEADFKPMKGGFAKHTIQSEIKYNKDKIYREIKNVFIGDVWICAGQENMDEPISKFPHVKSKLLEIENQGLKFTAIKKTTSATPKTIMEYDYATKKKWQPCKFGDALWGFSAVAYYFGEKITENTKFPIGLIEVTHSAPIEAWIPKEEYLAAGYKEKIIKNKDGKLSLKSSSAVYNGIVHPLTQLNFKGVLWSHGHANSLEPVEYGKLLKTLISSWRKRLNNPALPFFVAQTAPYKGNVTDKSGESLAWLRVSQASILSMPHTGVSSLSDTGGFEDLATQEPAKVGHRLALWAQRLVKKSTPVLGPTFKKITPGSGNLIVEFNNAGKGLKASQVSLHKAPGKAPGTDTSALIAKEGEVKGFEIAGVDGNFHPATAKISGARVQLTSKVARRPKYVRYAWSNFSLANVSNSYGLPMLPFRTDKLPAPNFDGSFPTSPVNLATASGESMKVKPLKDQKIQTENVANGRGFLFKKTKKEAIALFTVKSPEFQKGKSPKTDITVVFFDNTPGYLSISYDSSEKADKGSKLPTKAYKNAGKIKLSGTGTWKYARFSVKDAYFGQRLSASDLKISTGSGDMIISGVFLEKGK